ncbi:Acyl-CoA N-acyltransferases superfamily protein, putative isoform 2 [Theobroma cacao]|uniref:Acyl-CoA N-acyltransferases superfamily protein, putative isoform 2 n=1 Tax=Theobroma cacao TaxID=3641 RepID=A0A061G7B6_THECC|nr:Acyl-CoA N-acyltransferases superfamily protein, putative isoform 2 [Theobroma cacao]
MAHLLQSQSFISRSSVWTEPRQQHRHACVKLGDQHRHGSWKIDGKRRARGTFFNGRVVQCCTTSSSSLASSSAKAAVKLIDGNAEENDNGRWGDGKDQPLYLASEYGWKVRRLEEDQDEIRKVAQIQAEAFHQPMAFFDDFFFQFFQAEVLAALIYKLRNSPPSRRRKIASCLLKACDVLSVLWGFKFLVLRAYEDDFGARKLYSNAGYRVVSGDPPWMSYWIGRRRRVVLIKQCNFLNLI